MRKGTAVWSWVDSWVVIVQIHPGRNNSLSKPGDVSGCFLIIGLYRIKCLTEPSPGIGAACFNENYEYSLESSSVCLCSLQSQEITFCQLFSIPKLWFCRHFSIIIIIIRVFSAGDPQIILMEVESKILSSAWRRCSDLFWPLKAKAEVCRAPCWGFFLYVLEQCEQLDCCHF